MDGFAKVQVTKITNTITSKFVTHEYPIAAMVLTLCLLANLVDPLTFESNKSVFSAIVEFIGLIASLAVLYLSIAQFLSHGFPQINGSRSISYSLLVIVWLMYSLVGTIAGLANLPSSPGEIFGNSYFGYLNIINLAILSLVFTAPERLSVGFMMGLLGFALIIVGTSFIAAWQVIWSELGTWYGIFQRTEEATGFQISRSSGISRMCALFALLFLACLLFPILNKNRSRAMIADLFLICGLIISIMMVFTFQSRGAILSLVIAMCSMGLACSQHRLRVFVKERTLIVAVAGVCLCIGAYLIIESLFVPRFSNGSFWTGWSGRGDIWHTIISNQQHLAIGCGFQCDRYLSGQSASNGLVYSFATAGLVGAFSAIFTYVVALYVWVLAATQINLLSRLQLYALGVIPFLVFRTIPESGYFVFGFDSVFFFVSLGLLFKGLGYTHGSVAT